MTNHLRAIDIKEYAKALDVAKEFADRAEKAEAAIQRVRELHRTVVDEVFTDFGWDGEVEHCQECGYVPTDDEPCPTLAALNTATWLRSLTDGGVA